MADNNNSQAPTSHIEGNVKGKALREVAPRSSHGDWQPAEDRPDPISLLQAQDEGRIQQLLPIRYGRMLASPFAFLRGSAVVMAADLASTPNIGERVILCGDAHLSNFGLFASPERRLIFDINDFDEAYPGPWEWDLKRLAASLAIAGFYSKPAVGRAVTENSRCTQRHRQHPDGHRRGHPDGAQPSPGGGADPQPGPR